MPKTQSPKCSRPCVWGIVSTVWRRSAAPTKRPVIHRSLWLRDSVVRSLRVAPFLRVLRGGAFVLLPATEERQKAGRQPRHVRDHEHTRPEDRHHRQRGAADLEYRAFESVRRQENVEADK